MNIIKPPKPLERKGFKIFLAGSIEGDQAERWQDVITEALADLDITVFNPRRDSWDNSWEQTIENPEFNKQVTWELDGLDSADLIVMYFAPNTKSPISLLELGLYAASGRMIVCCPEGFWRKGNVDIVCERLGIQQVDRLDELIESIKGSYSGRIDF